MNLNAMTILVLTAMIGAASVVQAGVSGGPIQTPEPATLLLFAAGAVGVGLWRRQHGKK
jgi:hypothetical protein